MKVDFTMGSMEYFLPCPRKLINKIFICFVVVAAVGVIVPNIRYGYFIMRYKAIFLVYASIPQFKSLFYIYKEGETSTSIYLTVNSDDIPEPDEIFFIYLSQPEGGARIAQGDSDGGLKVK